MIAMRNYKDTDDKVSLLGFGLMRLPKIDPEKSDIDKEKAQEMIDYAYSHGINYFDTAYPYHEGKSELFVGEVDEIELSGGFFNYTEKYGLITSSIHMPARISQEKETEIQATAQLIYRALECSGFARVDLFLTPDKSGEAKRS